MRQTESSVWLDESIERLSTEEPYEWKSSRTDLWGERRVIAASTRKYHERKIFLLV